MESRSPGAGGGGGRPPPSATGPLRADSHADADPDERPGPARTSRPQPSPSSTPMLSLDQIRVVARCSNEYTDGPTVVRILTDQPLLPPLPPASGRHKEDEVALATTATAVRGQAESEALEERSRSLLPPSRHHDSLSSDENWSIFGGSSNEGSISSLQRLMGSHPPISGNGGNNNEETVRTQPKHGTVDAEERKPLAAVVLCDGGKHLKRCGDCGRCSCGECTRPRALPSCWLCGRRCVCSAQSVAEYATCVCCVRGLFYHCSNDDEDTGADKPFSCTQAHCCARWTTVTLLAAVLPCIACYLPAKACVAACQHCYDATARPGCRCKGGARHDRNAGANASQRDAGEKPT